MKKLQQSRIEDPRFRKTLLEKIRSIDSVISPSERHKYSIKDAKVGTVLKIEDEYWLVEDIAKYIETTEDFKKDKDWIVTELKLLSLRDGRIVYLEYEEDDEIEVTITDQELKFKDLSDDLGEAIDEDDLDEIADQEDSIFFKGEEYAYDDDWAARYEPSKGKEYNVYFYDFEAGEYGITIEEWQDDDSCEYSIWRYKYLPEEMIEIVALD